MFKLNSFSCRSRAWQIIGTSNYSEITDSLTGITNQQNAMVLGIKSNPVSSEPERFCRVANRLFFSVMLIGYKQEKT
jgi:hypothetical protein